MTSTIEAPASVTGAQLGLPFPSSIERLRAQGPGFLTKAFRATGALGADNRVTAITRAEEFFGGGAGRKMLLSVTYARPQPDLHTDLFVKYPRDFDDPLRELFNHLLEPETRFALLSRTPGFPVAVPKCYFADYDPQTRCGVLITERIAFGRDGVEPFYDKCLDYELPDPLAHYTALMKVIAHLAGAHKAGRFGAEIDRQFPYDPARARTDDRIPYTPQQLQEKVDAIADFARRYPRLLPPEIASADFLARFAQEAQELLRGECAVKRYLNADPDFIALCHWNGNVDNAWFWRNAEGEVEAGLLDWGSVSQMNVAQSLFGALCAVEVPFWSAHKDALIETFADEYRRSGGPALDLDTLKLHVRLYTGLLGLAWLVDAPALVSAQIADLDAIEDRRDPRFRANFLARCQLHLLVVLLSAWRSDNIGSALWEVPGL